eukprot:TRINITY_DN5445_c0_g2_i1.p1 TRINITY_DN5445_c0_g2~~TRINITY_DN5445_c0_g2_i1.p1  ORF type:complete len:323 (-),score=73.79 TRINITY_DN5445_c0_g2_i1:186-1082(-)
MKLSSVSKALGSLKHEIKHASPELAAVASKVDSAAKATLRKAVGESELERLLRYATSAKSSGCSNSMLQGLAQASEYAEDCQLILQKVFRRLQPSEDRHQAIMKTLTLVEYLILHGSEHFFKAMRQEQQRVQALMDISWAGEGRSSAGTIRTKATRVIVLLTDRELLDAERAKAWSLQEQVATAASKSSHSSDSCESSTRPGGDLEEQKQPSPLCHGGSSRAHDGDNRALAPLPPPPPREPVRALPVQQVDLLDLSPARTRSEGDLHVAPSCSSAEPAHLLDLDLLSFQPLDTTIPCA